MRASVVESGSPAGVESSVLVAASSVDRLAAEICELSGQLAAGMARLVIAIAEFDDLKGWEAWGCQSVVHWLSWRCGLGMHAAREKVRVGHALQLLPLIRQSFARGELSYSQVRAVTRIAGPHNEAALIDCARDATAHQLERLVAATARSERIWDQGFAEAQWAERFFRSGIDYDQSMFTARLALTPEDGKFLTNALTLAVKQMVDERGDQGPQLARDQLMADALVEMARSVLASGLNGRSATDEYRVVSFNDHRLVANDPGHGDCDDYEVVDPGVFGRDGCAVDRSDSEVSTDSADHCEAGDGAVGESPHAPPRAHLERGAVLTAATIRRIWCDTTVTRISLREGTIVAIDEPTRTISAALRRALGLRDSQCRFPGCNSRRVDAHHIRYRRNRGATTLENLLSLCRFHHRLVHEGGYAVGRGADGAVRFYDPAGRELHHGSGLEANGGVDALRADHRERGHHIDPTTIVGTHCGDRLDLAYATSVLARPSVRPGTRAHQPASPRGPKLN